MPESLLATFQSSPALTIGTALLVGLLVGSFLNVVILRLPRMMDREWVGQAAEILREKLPAGSARTAFDALTAPVRDAAARRYDLAVPRSACPHCGHAITALENVPIASWLWLRGRCSACRAPISARYPLVEAATGVLCAAAAWKYGATFATLAAVTLTCFLIALAMIDLDTQLLPDDMTVPLLWIGLLVNLFGIFSPLADAVIGAIAGYLALWSVYWLFRLATGKEGMGHGDFKLLAALGAWFGWASLPAIVLLSSAVGAAVGLAMIAGGRLKREVPIPFGPYLAGAGLLALYLREPIDAWLGLR